MGMALFAREGGLNSALSKPYSNPHSKGEMRALARGL